MREAPEACGPTYIVSTTSARPILVYKNGRIEPNTYADVIAAANALSTFASSLAGCCLRSVASAGHRILLLSHPPLSFLAVVPSTSVHMSVLKTRLNLVHAQLVSLLTLPAIRSLFERNPGYDIRSLLCGSGERVMDRLIGGFEDSPCSWLGAVRVGGLGGLGGLGGTSVGKVLERAVARTGSVFGAVFVRGRGEAVGEMAGRVGLGLSPWDLMLLENLCACIGGGRHGDVDGGSGSDFDGDLTVTPVCLPFYDSCGNFHAHVRHGQRGRRRRDGGQHEEIQVVLLSGMLIEDMDALRDATDAVLASMSPSPSPSRSPSSTDAVLASMSPSPSPSPSPSSTDAVLAPSGAIHRHVVFKDTRKQQYVSTDGIPASCNGHFGWMRAAMFAQDDGNEAGALAVGDRPLQAFRLERVGAWTYTAFASAEAELYMCTEESFEDDGAAARFAAEVRARVLQQREALFS